MSAPAQPIQSVISKENIKVAAETVGVELTDDVVKTLCHEVEYRVREILLVHLPFALFFATFVPTNTTAHNSGLSFAFRGL